MATAPQTTEASVVHHVRRKAPGVTTEAIELASPTPLILLQQAIAQGVSIEQLERLQLMHERWEANQARKAFVAAMNQFRADPPRIVKNQNIHFESKKTGDLVDYKHATLDRVCDAVIGGLSKVGISFRWTVAQEKEWIKVSCILTHELGHSEETTLMGTPDLSGSKNSIQAIGSTVTYLQRYTLLAATGLATANQDNDGRGSTANGIPDDRVEEMVGEISRAQSVDQLKKIYFFAYREAETQKDRSAMAAYSRAKDARKRELQ